ncbi:MAG TPA: hypothetical protein VE987_18075 [Polyangiaceae bacterium]|nr:hypothetical protein [Polyangiaceae bacterium]
MRQSTCLWALLVASVATVTPRARADEAADTAAARALGGDGITLADSGDCQQAIEKLRRAEELHHAPTTAGRLGECEIGVGRLVVGTERLQRLLREPLAPNAPAPFVDAMARARRVLEHALPRIASLRISVRVPAGTRVQVTVDGERLPEALLDNDRPADPGRHTVVASAAGYYAKTEEVTLGDGETSSVSLELAPDRSARPVPAPDAERDHRRIGTAAAEAPTSKGGGAAPIVALGVGAVGLAAGIAGGVMVALDSADLSKACGPSRICPADKQSEINAAKTWATVSTVGFAVAGAGLGTGLMLLLLGNHHESAGAAEARVRPVVGPLYFGCEGAL